jgi:methylenetetrahydrofolate reductase (NADPH)
VVDEFKVRGVRHFVALRGDPQGGVGTRYTPHPDGFENAADLVRGLRDMGEFEISVSAYPEKHPESINDAADIDMLKRKVDAGATRALTQFFFDNDLFEQYLNRVRHAGITIPIVPGIMPIQNLSQLKRFASMCGASVPVRLDQRFEGTEGDAQARAEVAADVAAEQIADLAKRGVEEFHLYTMNRAPLTIATLERVGFGSKSRSVSGAAA